MKKKYIIVIITLLILLGGGYWYWGTQSSNTTSAEPQIYEIKRGTIENIVTAQGTLEPKNYVDVGAQVSGLIEKMHVEIGDTVKVGDLIAEIDPDVYESQVAADKARLKQLNAQKAQQQALVKQAQWKFDRNKTLFSDKAVSKEVLEDAEITLDVAKANLLSLEAQIEQAESELEGDETNLGYTTIYSPMDGTVVDQAVQEGQTINANQTTPTIVQVANMDIMTAKAEVAEADVMKLQKGIPMYFTTLGSGERRWEGTIRQVLPTPEEINDVVLYNVLVDVQNEDHSLLPGMTTQMFFVLEKAENVPLIPANALGKRVQNAGGDNTQAHEVKVLSKNGNTEIRTVVVGISNRTEAAVIEGLVEGDRVVEQVKVSASTGSGGRTRMPRL